VLPLLLAPKRPLGADDLPLKSKGFDVVEDEELLPKSPPPFEDEVEPKSPPELVVDSFFSAEDEDANGDENVDDEEEELEKRPPPELDEDAAGPEDEEDAPLLVEDFTPVPARAFSSDFSLAAYRRYSITPSTSGFSSVFFISVSTQRVKLLLRAAMRLRYSSDLPEAPESALDPRFPEAPFFKVEAEDPDENSPLGAEDFEEDAEPNEGIEELLDPKLSGLVLVSVGSGSEVKEDLIGLDSSLLELLNEELPKRPPLELELVLERPAVRLTPAKRPPLGFAALEELPKGARRTPVRIVLDFKVELSAPKDEPDSGSLLAGV